MNHRLYDPPMQAAARQIAFVLVALAFLIAGAAQPNAAIAALPCMADEHHGHHHDGGKHQPCDSGQICACCVAISFLPAGPAATTDTTAIAQEVTFWERIELPGGRSILPDPAPPRPIA